MLRRKRGEKAVRGKVLRTFRQFFEENRDTRVLGLYGGAGSGKSYSVATILCSRFINERNKRILITRKTFPALRLTSWYTIVRILHDWGVPAKINKADYTITYKNNEIVGKSLDDPEKIKSTEFNYIWIEEATEVNKEDYLQTDLRLRRDPGKDTNQLICTFNPIDEHNWAVQEFYPSPKRSDATAHHSNYQDNKFLGDEYRRTLEALADQDENYYQVYTLGVPGHLKDLIYTHYDFIPRPPAFDGYTGFGLDFGFNKPAALVGAAPLGEEVYLEELLYETGLTNLDLINRVKQLIPEHRRHIPIYADPAEPKSIEEFRRAGFTVIEADNRVKPGIDKLKRFRLKIQEDSINLQKEIRAYKWREDPRTKQILDEPVKLNDHLMDAARYCVFTSPYFPDPGAEADAPMTRRPKGRKTLRKPGGLPLTLSGTAFTGTRQRV